MGAKIGDLIRIKDVNMLSLYYSVQKITNVLEHHVSKRLGYVFKINEQEVWVDDSQSQVLVPEEDKSSDVEKLVSLRVIIDSIGSLIRSFGVTDSAFDYCLQLCSDSNSLDTDYQQILTDFQSGKEIDKFQLKAITAKYYDVLDLIEKTLNTPEVTKNIFTKLVNALQILKFDYFPVVAQNTQTQNIEPEISTAPLEVVENPEIVLDADNADKPLENSIENIDLSKEEETEEEITEKINFLKSMLMEEGIDKEVIEAEIKTLEEGIGSLLNKVVGGDGKYYLVGVLDHSNEVFMEGPKDKDEDFDNAVKIRNTLAAVNNKTAASKMKVIVGKKNAEKYKAELESESINESWTDYLGLLVPPLIATMGIIGAILGGKKEDANMLDPNFSPKDDKTVTENIGEIYSRFKEFLNQASDKASVIWNKLTAKEFEKLIDDKKTLPEIQKNQLVDLFNLLKEHETEVVK